MDNYLDEMKRAEADWFDGSAQRRTTHGQIPLQADIRRSTRYIPTSPYEELIDPQMTDILEKYYRDRFIGYAAHRKNGKVLDLCCGPGWLALELGRMGQTVEAYDLSPEAIKLAQRMLEENPYKENFGQVNYHVKDITKEDLGIETYDAITGWSAWHHLNDLPEFIGRAYHALKPGGIVATFDDLPRGRLEKIIERTFRLLLPTYDRTYGKKLGDSFLRITGKTKEAPDFFTPMEEVAAKDTAVVEIADLFYSKFEVLWDIQFHAFANSPSMVVIGPDWFRYAAARLLAGLDRALCKIGLTKGYYRIIVARKPELKKEQSNV